MQNQETLTLNDSNYAALLGKIDSAISELQESFTHFQNHQEEKMTPSYESAIHAEKQYPAPHLAQKEFIKYMIQGTPPLESKSILLSRDQERCGYLIPCSTLAQLEEKMKHMCPMRSLAKVDKINSDFIELLIDKWATDAGWTLNEETSETDIPELTKLRIPTHQLYARPKASQKILDDAGDSIEEWLITKITQKMAALENHAFLHGDGENQPKGILSYPLVPVGQGEWGKIECIEQLLTESGIERKSLFEIVSATKPEYLSNASWLMSRSAMVAIQNITDGQGRFLLQPSLSSETPSSLLGYPVVITDDMPQLTNQENCTPILFGNFLDAYQIVDRGEVSVLRDPYSAKPYVEFYVTKRVGGDVVDFNALKGLNLVKV